MLISASPPTPIPRLRDLIFNDKLNLKTLIPPTKCPLSTHLLRWDQMTHNKALSLVRYPHFSHKKWGLKDVQRPAGDYTTEGLSSLRHSGPKTLFPSPLCLKKTQNAFWLRCTLKLASCNLGATPHPECPSHPLGRPVTSAWGLFCPASPYSKFRSQLKDFGDRLGTLKLVWGLF